MSALLISMLCVVLSPGEIPAVAGTELLDQRGSADSLAAHRGAVVVVMVVTARRLRNLKPWERDLRNRFDAISFLRVADIPAEPPVTHEKVARKLEKRVPEDVAILIDLERHWARELELDTGRPNLLVFDAEGRFVAAFRGRHDPTLLDEVSAALDGLAITP